MAAETSIRRIFCQLDEFAVAVGDDVGTAQVVAVVEMEVGGTSGVGRGPCPEGKGMREPAEGAISFVIFKERKIRTVPIFLLFFYFLLCGHTFHNGNSFLSHRNLCHRIQ